MRLAFPLLLVLALSVACANRSKQLRIPRMDPDARVTVEATGYCPCEVCCGWERTWWGKPVYAYGPQKGRRKEPGITASGTEARRGTIAADARVPFGTLFYVPGYGMGRVEDRGGAIQGTKIDLFFPTHTEALAWGRRTLDVFVWYGPAGAPDLPLRPARSPARGR